MPKLRLTERFCVNTPLVNPSVFYTDSATSGLALKVSKTKRSFYLYKKIDGKPTKRHLGDVPSMSLKEAREELKKVLYEKTNGRNLRTKREKRMTFGELYEIYVTDKRDGGGKNENWIRGRIGGIQGIMLSDFKLSDIESLYIKESKRTSVGTANRILSVLNAVIRFGFANYYLDDIRIAATKKRGVSSRSRALTLKEFQKFYAAVETLRSVHSRTFLKVLCLTGLRASEVKNIIVVKDFKSGSVIRNTKTTTNRPVVFSSHCVDVLNKYCADTGRKPGETVFTIKTPRSPMATACGRVKFDNFHIHDIRRTVATLQVELGAGVQTVAATLGHGKSASVIDTYVRARATAQLDSLNMLSSTVINKD